VNGQQQATITVSFPSAGTHTIQAAYSPDAASTGVFNASASNTVNEIVNNGAATTTTLTASPNPAQINQQVTLTAIVAPQSGGGTPTGTIGFADLSNGGPPWARSR
jgi:large repetitive protein